MALLTNLMEAKKAMTKKSQTGAKRAMLQAPSSSTMSSTSKTLSADKHLLHNLRKKSWVGVHKVPELLTLEVLAHLHQWASVDHPLLGIR